MTEPILPLLYQAAPLLPVITLHDSNHAKPLADALLAGGFGVMEITLRTDAALPAIRTLNELPDLIVGAGSITRADQCQQVLDAGAAFTVSPGYSDELAIATSASRLPWLPGVATASEMLQALEHGYSCVKFFPATAMGGAATLKACTAVFPELIFCPTGGINARNAAEFLALPCVPCVGGSWVVPQSLIVAEDWSSITNLAVQAKSLTKPDSVQEMA